MKFKVTLKDPDGFYEGITDALKDETRNIAGLSDDERDDLIESRREDVEKVLSEWVKYNEYITIEFDTDAKTATVCKQK